MSMTPEEVERTEHVEKHQSDLGRNILLIAIAAVVLALGAGGFIRLSHHDGKNVSYVTPSTAPVAPVDPTTTAPVAPVVAPAGECRQINSYELSPTLLEVSTHNTPGYWIHVQFFVNNGPEMEAVLTHGRYTIDRANGGPRGFVWEFGPSCSRDFMEADMAESINRRKANHANTIGVADQATVNTYFHKVA